MLHGEYISQSHLSCLIGPLDLCFHVENVVQIVSMLLSPDLAHLEVMMCSIDFISVAPTADFGTLYDLSE